ncbi:hypothetical protein EGW08_002158 [Elysia chlorotica]|uniref:Guanylate cyclase n=1 Tax=Elysia chlorotica TaxID=188477 RepID=A0A433U8J6_ELYCH|nr:hypothetical protein EGW08_002158 [Elysia chlorotica]
MWPGTYEKGNDLPNEKGARSLLVVKPSPNADIQEFHNNVRLYNKKPPLNFTAPQTWKKIISVYASYLYDAVMLYARALGDVVAEGGSVMDGKRIISKTFGKTYESIEGYLVKIDQNGSAEGNYSVLACQPNVLQDGQPEFLMQPVAHFRLNQDGVLPIYHIHDGVTIRWLHGKPPLDEPPCGYRGQKCIKPKSHLKEIIGGIFGGIVLIAAVTSLLIYRNWRYEQEIAGLLWKIDASAIHCNELYTFLFFSYSHIPNFILESSVPLSCIQGISMVSIESRNSYAQVYTYIGKYKGQTIALKTFNIDSSDLTRKDKLEMKTMRDLRHTNVNSFIGACMESSVLTLVTAYCVKGSLQDVLENDDIKLDHMFIASLIKDLLQGMLYIHNSDLVFHGNLKSSNCVVNSRWTLQVTDHGLLDTRNSSYRKEDHYAYYRNLLWKSPEILRSNGKLKASQQGDVYAFAIILHEIFGRMGPYGSTDMDPEDIIENVKRVPDEDKAPFRPNTDVLNCDDYVIDVMTSCWAEIPEVRPNFTMVWNRLKPMRTGMKRNIFDHMLAMMEKYQEHLEELVDERTEQLQGEKKKTESLLYRMLPRSVADHLKKGEAVIPEAFDSVTIYFSDICGFTALSAESTPMQIVDMLNDLYTCFDSTIKNFDVYKVETIGDAYMVVSGLPIRNGNSHAAEIASMSLSLLFAIKSFSIRHKPGDTLKLRIGIHSGPCVAGVVGLTMPRYTLFGDTVNTASRMESNGEALKIHCSSSCKHILDLIGGFHLEERGYVAMKGKGEQLTYWLQGEDRSQRSDLQQDAQQLMRTVATLDTEESGIGPSISPHGSRRELTSPNSLGSSSPRVIGSTRQGSPAASIEHQSSASVTPSALTPTVTPRKAKSPRDFNSRHNHFSFSSTPSPSPLTTSNQSQFLHPHHNSISNSQHNVNIIFDHEDATKSGSYPEGINGILKPQKIDQHLQRNKQHSNKRFRLLQVRRILRAKNNASID